MAGQSDFSTLSPFAIALLASLFLLGRGQVKVPPLRLLILVGSDWLALLHGRHQMLLGVCAPILLAPALAEAWPAKGQPAKPLFAALAVMRLVPLLTVARLALPVARGDDPVSPATALAHVPRFVRETPVLNDYSFGGYLIWNGVQPFIDSRADLYGDIFLANYATITAPDQDALAATLTYYHVRWTIFRRRRAGGEAAGRPARLASLYQDKLAVVHVHD